MNLQIATRLFLVIHFAFASSAHARLGETLGQSQQRYGQPREDLELPNDAPLMVGALEKSYELEGWRIRAAFVNGVCVRIEYAHMPENALPKPITNEEIESILKAETSKSPWREEKATKQPGAIGELEKALKGAFNLRRWSRGDRATAELALGIVLKLELKEAAELARKLAKEAQEKGKKPQGNAKVPKF